MPKACEILEAVTPQLSSSGLKWFIIQDPSGSLQTISTDVMENKITVKMMRVLFLFEREIGSHCAALADVCRLG